jgi:hypothetical protein
MPTQQNFLEILKNPYDLDKNTLLYLETMTKTYPYCQSLQIMLAKNLQQTDKLAFEKQVNKASAYTTDRRKFQRYISDRDRSGVKPTETKRVQQQTQPPVERSMTLLEIVKKRLAEIRSKNISPGTTKTKPLPMNGEAETAVQEVRGHSQEHAIVLNQTHQEIPDRKNSLNENNSIINSQPAEIIPEKAKEIQIFETKDKRSVDLEQIKSLDLVNQSPDSKTASGEKTVLENASSHSDNNKTVREIPRILSHNDSFPYPTTRKQAARPDINYLIDKFLKEEPRIKAKRELPEKQADLSEDSTREHPQLVSETLAAVYMKQGNKEKALDVYEKLCLKFPEKSSYFAQKIIAIKNDIN